MKSGEILLLICGVYLILTTFLSFHKSTVWWIRVLEFPRLQSFLFQIAILGFYLAFFFDATPWQIVFSSFLVAGIITQGKMILPFTPLVNKEVPSSQDHKKPVRIYISNVYQENRNSSLIKDQIENENPDIIMCVETDEWWDQELKYLEKDYPYNIKKILNNTYGIIFYSRLDFLNPEIRHLVEEDVPGIKCEIVLPTGAKFNFYGVHPKPPVVGHSNSSFPRDLELLLVGKEAKKDGKASVVCGDLNDVAWSRTTKLFRKISGLLDPRVGRGFFCTFHAKYFIFRWALDHIFVSREFKLKKMKRLSDIGSDHFPVVVELTYEPPQKVDFPFEPQEIKI